MLPPPATGKGKKSDALKKDNDTDILGSSCGDKEDGTTEVGMGELNPPTTALPGSSTTVLSGPSTTVPTIPLSGDLPASFIIPLAAVDESLNADDSTKMPKAELQLLEEQKARITKEKKGRFHVKDGQPDNPCRDFMPGREFTRSRGSMLETDFVSARKGTISPDSATTTPAVDESARKIQLCLF
jgi:hypothetical protein